MPRQYDLWTVQKQGIIDACKETKTPVSAMFELTPYCSLKCRMCYMRLERGEAKRLGAPLPAEEWIALGRQAIQMGTLFLTLTGGEPLLRPDFSQIYEALCSMGFLVKLFTNATLVTSEVQALFKRIPPSAVGITIYGASEETYETVCGNGKGFRAAMEGLDFFGSLGVPVQIRATVVKENQQDFEAIRAMALERNMAFGYCAVPYKAVRGAKSQVEDMRLSPCALADFDAFVNASLSQEELAAIRREQDGEDNGGAAMYCSAGRSAYCITWNGNITPCLMMEQPAYPVAGGALAEGWNRIKAYPDTVERPAACQGCKYSGYCGVCPGALLAETGRTDTVSPYICGYGKAMYEKYHQE